MVKSKRVVYVAVITFLVVIVAVSFFKETDELYGNDKQSIQQVIQSIEGYKHQSIEIIEVKDIYDDRIVGFLANNNPSYIHFEKNENGDYTWNYIETKEDLSLAIYRIYITSEKADVWTCMVVTTKENEVAKLLLDIDGEVIEQDFGVKQNSVVWIDFPEVGMQTQTYMYFDENGNEISNKTQTRS